MVQTMSAAVTISLDPQGDTATVRLGEFLGGDRFPAFRSACVESGARYVPEERCNRLPASAVPALMDALLRAGLGTAVDAALAARLAEDAQQARALLEAGRARLEAAASRLATQGDALRRYQEAGVEWLAPRARAILGDEMGLGKTPQALVSLPDRAAALVVCPAGVRSVWVREARRWRSDLTVVDSPTFRWPAPGELVVVSYGALPEGTLDMPPAGVSVICDEAHLLKNPRSKRARAAKAVFDQVTNARGTVWLVTGTPLLNRPPELGALLKLVGLFSEAFGSWSTFCRLFRAQRGSGGYAWGEPSDEVPDRLRRVMLRRRRSEVLSEIPPKARQDVLVPVNAEAARLCDEVVAILAREGTDLRVLSQGMPAFREISRARAALATAKVPAMLELVESYEEQDEPLVVFSAHLPPVEALRGRPGWEVITGATPADERGRIVDAFQRGDLRGVAGTIGAMGVGVTLTRACHLLLVDMDWTPALNSQAEDRVCRFGQTRGVLVTRLVAQHDLDARVVELLTLKQEIIERSVEASAVPEGYVAESPAERLARSAERATRQVADLAALATERAATRAAEQERFRAESLARVPDRDGREVRWGADGNKRSAAGPAEEWAAKALMTLAHLDPDGARELNGVGFNRVDGRIGHSIARQLRDNGGLLTGRQWEVTVTIASHYPRQVGQNPLKSEAPPADKEPA